MSDHQKVIIRKDMNNRIYVYVKGQAQFSLDEKTAKQVQRGLGFALSGQDFTVTESITITETEQTSPQTLVSSPGTLDK